MSHRSAEQCILLNYVTIGFDVMNKFDRIQNSAACNTNENTYVCVCVCVCVCVNLLHICTLTMQYVHYILSGLERYTFFTGNVVISQF